MRAGLARAARVAGVVMLLLALGSSLLVIGALADLSERAGAAGAFLERLNQILLDVERAAITGAADHSASVERGQRVAAARQQLDSVLRTDGLPESVRSLVVRADAVLQQAQRRLDAGPVAVGPDQGALEDAGEVAADLRRAIELVGEARAAVLTDLDASVASLSRLAVATCLIVGASLVMLAAAWVAQWRERHGAADDAQVGEMTRLLAAAVRSTDEGVLISDTGDDGDGPTIVFVNRSFHEMLGLSEGELVGQPLRVLRESCLREREFSVLEHGHSDSKSASIETVRWREDGSKLHCAWHISPVRDGGGRVTHFISVLRDITQLRFQEEAQRKTHEELLDAYRKLRENQEQLVQSEKMAFLGQLAAGVAHEINNPVGYVMSNLGTLAEMMDDVKDLVDAESGARESREGGVERWEGRSLAGDPEAAAEFLDDLDGIIDDSRAGLVQVRDIVERLKNFARPDEGTIEEADVNAQVASALKIVWNEVKHRCTVTTRLGELPLLRCRPGRLTQVFTNLIVNAAQAIPTAGTITITTAFEEPDIVVCVADDGDGIAPEHLSDVFAPFFTTKPAGQGTGLGLAVSYGIVRNHGGTIEVESEVGKGSVFIVRLPVGWGAEETSSGPQG